MLTPTSFRGVRHFARTMLADGRVPIRLDDARATRVYRDCALEVVLFREACWQIEIICAMPHASAPRHMHPHVDSCELGLGGSVVGDLGYGAFATRKARGSLAANLIAVPAGQWHGGAVGAGGAAFLSFQRWRDGIAPTWITDDWVPWEAAQR